MRSQLVYSPCAYLDSNGVINITRIQDGKLVSQALLTYTCVNMVAWISEAEDRYTLASGCSDGTAIVWNIKSYRAREICRRTYDEQVERIEYSDASRRLFITYNKSIALWKVGEDRGEEIHHFNCEESVGGMGVLTSGSVCAVSQPRTKRL